jgi:hypothetical protein
MSPGSNSTGLESGALSPGTNTTASNEARFGYLTALPAQLFSGRKGPGKSKVDNQADYIHGDVQEAKNNKGYLDNMTWRESLQFSGKIDETFGSAIAMNADATGFVVGARTSKRGGFESGEIRIYFPYQEGKKSFSFIGSEGDQLGKSVAISFEGNLVAACAIGHVNVYARGVGGYWFLQDKITEQGNPHFGEAVALSSNGALLVVGTGTERKVSVYDRTLEGWAKKGQRLSSDASDDGFGSSIAVSSDGSVIAVGAPRGGALGQGSVSLFRAAAGDGQIDLFRKAIVLGQRSELIGLDSEDSFGSAISLSSDGHRIAVGAHQATSTGMGYVELYDWTKDTLSWSVVGQVLLAPGDGELFGTSVSLSEDGSSVSIGSRSVGDKNGVAQVWRMENGRWKLVGADVLTVTTGESKDSLVALSRDGMIVMVGAPLDTSTDNLNVGKVCLFELS